MAASRLACGWDHQCLAKTRKNGWRVSRSRGENRGGKVKVKEGEAAAVAGMPTGGRTVAGITTRGRTVAGITTRGMEVGTAAVAGITIRGG